MPDYKGDLIELGAWIKREYNDAILSRRKYEQLLNEWDRQYESQPRIPVKTFPWVGASNLEVPVGATHVDAIDARLESVYFSTQPTVNVRPLGGAQYEKHCEALQAYLNEVSLPNSGFRDEKAADLLTMTKLGTSFLWLTYDRQYKRVRDTEGKPQDILLHEGPTYRAVHPRNLIFPPDARNLQRSRWLSIRSYKTWGELSSDALSHGYDKDVIESLRGRGYGFAMADHNEQAREKRQGVRRAGGPKQWEIVTTYAQYQTEEMEIPEDLWFIWHNPSGQILKCMYNPYEHYQWPLSKSVYMMREDAFVGIGVMGMLQAIQEEVTNIHNYCLDNMLAANTIVGVGKKNAVEKFEVYPMSLIEYAGDDKSIRFERLGQTMSGQQVGEAAANLYAERRTGVGDSNFPSAGSAQGIAGVRTPATTALAMLGESNKRFQLAIDNSKRSDGEMLMQHVMLLRQYWPLLRSYAEAWDMSRARLITEFFSLDVTAFRLSLVIEISASSTMLNKDIERQNMMVLAEFMKGFLNTYVAFVQIQAQFPAMREQVGKILDGITKFAVRLLQTFDVKEPERFLPKLDAGTEGTAPPTESPIDSILNNFLNGTVGAGVSGNGQY